MSFLQNVSLKPYNTFGINVIARQFYAFNSLAALEECLYQASPALILGGGSNILFTQNVNGLVLHNTITGIELVAEDKDYYYVKAAAGENWHQFVQYCIRHQYAGIENLSLIPGNVGASPMQNIGAYGVEIKDVFHQLEAFHINDKTVVTFNANDCCFGYRESVFKNKYRNQFIILNVTYKLLKQPVYNTSYGAIEQQLQKMQVQQLSIKAIADAVIAIRSSKLPNPQQIGNAGSFFKNPVVTTAQYETIKTKHAAVVAYAAGNTHYKLAAGWLIEQAGWKGYRNGDAGCHAQQALVLVNYGNASGQQIFELSETIVQDVYNKFGVLLQREVNIM
jgi:UDP-N-acetylmuramate dehydrogenase